MHSSAMWSSVQEVLNHELPPALFSYSCKVDSKRARKRADSGWLPMSQGRDVVLRGGVGSLRGYDGETVV
jgi:hypothetical protein